MSRRSRYARPEFERRFLLEAVPAGLQGAILVEDRYLAGTRLRLRRIRDDRGRGPVSMKLGHKVRPDPNDPSLNMHTSFYLNESEYQLLADLPAQNAAKLRYRLPLGGLVASVDEYVTPRRGLILLEVEMGSREALDQFAVPDYAGREVTWDEAYTGFGVAAQLGE